MAILYNATGSELEAMIDMSGDGASTSLLVDLTNPPLNLDLKGNNPAVLFHSSLQVVNNGVVDPTFSAVITLVSGTRIFIVLNKPLPDYTTNPGVGAVVRVSWLFGGV